MRVTASRAPSGAASRGAQRARTRKRTGAPISCGATSEPSARTRPASRTSPTCAAGKASCSSHSRATPTAARSAAGSSPITCAPTSSSTRSGSHSPQRGPGANVALVHHSDRGSQPEFTSIDYSQTLDDHGVLASVGSVGDAFDNAAAESFVDSFKTELIRDRVSRTRTQLELAVVEYVAWFNSERLHESLGDIPRPSSSSSTRPIGSRQTGAACVPGRARSRGNARSTTSPRAAPCGR